MTSAIDRYLAEFAAIKWQLPESEQRQDACHAFSRIGFPSRKSEEWKYTDLNAFLQHPFTAAVDPTLTLTLDQLKKWQIPDLDCYQLIFINGLFSQQHSHYDNLQFENIAQQSVKQIDAFSALNNAFVRDGVVLTVKMNISLKPIHIIHLTAQADLMTNTCNKIKLEEGATATIIESFVGENDVAYFSNTVTEIILEDNSFLSHYKIQRQGSNAFHVDRLLVHQAKRSVLNAYSFSIGGTLSRSDIEVTCREQSTCELTGLYLGQNKQQVDHQIILHHKEGQAKSRQNYKGILSDQAKGVFSGKVIVDSNAQQSDAKQINKNLLLSPHAEVVTKPQLEIAADDVKCAHGATVGQCDEKALFYLQSRGLSLEEAKRLLVVGFCCDIINSIKCEPVKNNLQQIIEGLSWPNN